MCRTDIRRQNPIQNPIREQVDRDMYEDVFDAELDYLTMEIFFLMKLIEILGRDNVEEIDVVVEEGIGIVEEVEGVIAIHNISQ
jgi:hypothetical protein